MLSSAGCATKNSTDALPGHERPPAPLRSRCIHRTRRSPDVADFAVAEAASALSSQVRSGQRPKADVEIVFAEMDHWLAAKAESIDVESSDVVMATRLMRTLDLPLRTGDAIHLAIARRLDAVLATFDQKMAESAAHIGLKIATD